MASFDQLKADYTKLWSSMVIRPDKSEVVTGIARKLIEHKTTYESIEYDTGVPWFVIAALHQRESNADFATYLGNGEPFNRVTRLVPAGRGPFGSFEQGAIDAIRYDGLDQVDDWSPERACYEIEKFNGFGYRNNHPDVKSPYLWSFTNHYAQGKYVADGHFSATAVDQQCGAIPVLKRIMELTGSTFDDDEPPAKPEAPKAKGWLQSLLEAFIALITPKARAPALPPTLAERIVAAMKKRGHHLDTDPGEVNIVYVEGMEPNGTPNGNPPDKWNDLRCVISFVNDVPIMKGIWRATTEPGFYYGREHVIGHAEDGTPAAAHIAFGQQRAWRVGFHRNDPNRPALVQALPVTVYRDRNRAMKRDGPTETGDYGINQHDGQDGNPESIGAHSAGCLVVRSRAEHADFMRLVKADPRYVADHRFVFSTTVLPAAEIL